MVETKAPKIKIKVTDKPANNVYQDEALGEGPIEEHIILRLPPSLAEPLGETIRKRQPPPIKLNFTEPRKGNLIYGNKAHSIQIVDLPCIVESLKTFDQKQFYKIADVSQMIVVDTPPVKDYSWPHGLTPPLEDVRRHRFRKRMNKKIIEIVEEQVEALLIADAESEEVLYELHERREDEQVSDVEQDLVQEIEDALEEDFVASDSSSDDEEEEEEEEEEVEEEEEEDREGETEEVKAMKQTLATLKDEIKSLQSKINEKSTLAMNQVNPIMKRRFEEIVTKLTHELDLKMEQMEAVQQELEEE